MEATGYHLLIDLWGAEKLNDAVHIENTLKKAVQAGKATLLHIHLHRFTPNGGISGVAVLAESHITIHTWPEKDFAAVDIFMCGDTAPEQALNVLKNAFSPERTVVKTCRRGEHSPKGNS